ncbi:MAG: metal ABC transporter ATP-binding protein [Anaerolineales bacterium]
MQLLKRLKPRSPIRDDLAHSHGAPALELRNLSVHFGEIAALENVSLRVEKGQRVAVVGPNGAGKSTLFNVIAGVLPASSGDLLVHGHAPSRHICIAYVTQSYEVDWSFPVSSWDVVMMGRAGRLGLMRRPGPRDRQLAEQSLATVGLSDLATRQIGELSGGQRQRLFIARALAQEAEVVLLDEPLAGLDLPSQEQIINILDDLKKRKVTVLFATHDLDLASERFDKILLLNRRLIAFGNRDTALTAQNLAQAYGGHVQLVETAEGKVVVGDTGGHHGHDAEGRHG